MSYGGSPDFTFGSLGFKAYTLPSSTTNESLTANASVTQADGKTVVVGSLITGTGSTSTASFVAVRYNVDGTLDTTFSDGGAFTDPLLIATDPMTTVVPPVTAESIALQPDGKIVMVGSNQDTAIAVRLTTAGVLDTTFGGTGIVKLGTEQLVTTIIQRADTVAIQPDGKIAVGGAVQLTAGSFQPTPAIERLDTDGAVDTTYGTDGLVIVPLPAGSVAAGGTSFSTGYALIAQTDGELVMLNTVSSVSFNTSLIINRFTASGTPDATFGTAGQVNITAKQAIATGSYIDAAALAIQPDGKLVIGGSTGIPNYPSASPTALRLDANGTLDPTFGVGGFDILGGAAQSDGASGTSIVSLQPDGKILMGVDNSAIVVRLDTNGLPDTSFGTGGVAILSDEAGLGGEVVGFSVLSDGKILTLTGGNFGGNDNGFSRLLPSGAVNDFNEDGISDPAILNVSDSAISYQPSGGGAVVTTLFGTPGIGLTLPAPGAYDGGGVSEIAVYLPGLGAFAVRPYNGGADVVTKIGAAGFETSYPAPGDYDSAGRTDLGVYEPALGEFLYRRTFGGQMVTVPLGTPGIGQSIPAEADYYATGQDDFAVYLVTQGAFEIQNPVTGLNDIIPFGTPGAGQSIPVPGDYDGSGQAELAVYVPASGDLVYRSLKTGTDVIIPFGVAGIATTLPAPGDYSGSGKTEVAGYLTSQATFDYLANNGGAPVIFPLGIRDDSLAFAQGTNSVAESGIGPPASDAPSVQAESLNIPLTSDVLDTLAGTTLKKKAATIVL